MSGGAPKGNRHAAKGRDWQDAIRFALASYEDSTVQRGRALKEIAKTVVRLALGGDKDAYQEIGNRLDGKPVQAVEGSFSAHISETVSETDRWVRETVAGTQDQEVPKSLPN
jgi:hypothetical protein